MAENINDKELNQEALDQVNGGIDNSPRARTQRMLMYETNHSKQRGMQEEIRRIHLEETGQL